MQVLNFIKMSRLSAKISRELLVSQPNLLFNVCFSDFPLWFLKLSVATIPRFLILKYLNQFFRVFLAPGARKRLWGESKIHYMQQTMHITKCQGWCRGIQNSQSLGIEMECQFCGLGCQLWFGMPPSLSGRSAQKSKSDWGVNSCWMFMSNCRAWN